jgi:hypothetical protein
VLHDDGADHDEVDGTHEDGRPRRPLGRRLLVGALGTTVAVAGLAGAGALGVAGLGGLDVVTGTVPASAVGDDRPRPATPTEDPYLAGLTAEETPPPEGPDDRPPPVADERPSPAPQDDPRVVAYDVPDLDDAWDAALPAGLVTMSVGEQYRFSPTVPGQSCNGDDGVDPVAGRQWMWAEEASNRLDQLVVDVAVTGWAEGTGDDALDDVRLDRADCSWLGAVPDQIDIPVDGADGSWLGVRRTADEDVLHGAARTGDLLVGVQVWGRPGQDGADLAVRVMEEAVRGLQAADPGGAAG